MSCLCRPSRCSLYTVYLLIVVRASRKAGRSPDSAILQSTKEQRMVEGYGITTVGNNNKDVIASCPAFPHFTCHRGYYSRLCPSNCGLVMRAASCKVTLVEGWQVAQLITALSLSCLLDNNTQIMSYMVHQFNCASSRWEWRAGTSKEAVFSRHTCPNGSARKGGRGRTGWDGSKTHRHPWIEQDMLLLQMPDSEME